MRTLEDEAVRRANEGIRKAVRYKGKIVGYDTEFSDSLLIFMLKGGKPEKYKDRASFEHTGKDGRPLFDVATIREYMRTAPETGE